MMRPRPLCRFLLVVSLSLVLLGVLDAAADPITYRFSGGVFWQPNAILDRAVSLGDTFQGTFVVDPSAAATRPPEASLAFFVSPLQSITVLFESGYSVGGKPAVLVSDAPYGSSYAALAGAPFPPQSLDGRPVAGFKPVTLEAWFTSSGASRNPELSLDVADLGTYALRTLQLQFGRVVGPGTALFYPVYGEITEVSRMPDVVTPEPGTLLLVGTGALAAWAGRRRATKRAAATQR